jgi:hypothetical protein
MRGLPPPPAGVLALTPTFDIDGAVASFTHHIAVPGSDLATVGQLETWLNSYLTFLTDLTTAVSHSGCSMVRVDLQRWGTLHLHLVFPVPPNAGAWTGGQVATAASVVAWGTADGGRGMEGHTFLPGFPDAFTDDHVDVNATGVGNIQAAAVTYLNAVAALAGVTAGNCSLGVVHRSAGGAPLGVATFSPVLYTRASRVLGTLDRRRTLGH